jgi:hypothetical protein
VWSRRLLTRRMWTEMVDTTDGRGVGTIAGTANAEVVETMGRGMRNWDGFRGRTREAFESRGEGNGCSLTS